MYETGVVSKDGGDLRLNTPVCWMRGANNDSVTNLVNFVTRSRADEILTNKKSPTSY